MEMEGVRQPYSGQFRIPFVQRCRLEGSAGPGGGLIRDLSATGAYVALEPVPATGERFVVSFPLGGPALPLALPAIVTWRNTRREPRVPDLPPGCGLRFVGLSPQHSDRLQKFVVGYLKPLPAARVPQVGRRALLRHSPGTYLSCAACGRLLRVFLPVRSLLCACGAQLLSASAAREPEDQDAPLPEPGAVRTRTPKP